MGPTARGSEEQGGRKSVSDSLWPATKSGRGKGWGWWGPLGSPIPGKIRMPGELPQN